MSNFAKNQLLKYGWTEGKGLGKNEDGITKAIKPTLKLNTTGLGHQDTNFENWWEQQYNNAIKNLTITTSYNKVVITNTNTYTSIKTGVYGDFLKASVLTQNGSEKSETKEIGKNSADTLLAPLTDEQLFTICGDRTMHTTARHACTFNGKLKRIAQQDNMLLSANTSNVSNGQAGKEVNYFKSDDKIDIAKDKYKKDNDKIVPRRTCQLETTRFIPKCKKSIRKQKRKINNLVHQLSICNINENSMKSELTDKKSSRKKKKKLKRQKAKLIALRNSLKDENEIGRIVFPSITTKSKKEEIKQKQIEEYKDTYKIHFHNNFVSKCNHKKDKSRFSESQNWQKCASTIEQIEPLDSSTSQYQKLKAFHSENIQLLSTDDRGVDKSNKQEKTCCFSDPIKDAYSENILSGKFLPYGKYSALLYTSETGDSTVKQLKMLNTLKKKIKQKKKKKRSKLKKLDDLYNNFLIHKLYNVDHVAENLTSLKITTNSEV